ncbi:glycine radical enzyme, YjjI family [Kluyvera cryocrescens]|uniref:Glycine radical enzyme, YjjI family n=1 Tax=Kluyvera cryocrescens TaxID=580 RepID=A0A485BCR4_KLUCR|nr:glycine radical enzyme, YjjI family [Kluyvera cryocrescens]
MSYASVEGIPARYGKDDEANQLAYRISAELADFVARTPVQYGWQQRALCMRSRGSAQTSVPRRVRVCLMVTNRIR